MANSDMNDEDWVLGVDGGGTKTVAWLARREPTASEDVVGRGRAGPSNPSAIGIAAATSAIEDAIDSAFRDAQLARAPVAVACLALAGADRPAERDLIAAWGRQQQVASVLHLCNDAEPVLACTNQSCGVALIAGTGSFALGRNQQGELQKVGGWGFRLGDEGSGYAVAIAALTAAARYADHRGGATSLLECFMDHFSVSEPRDMISHVYAPQFDRRAVADLAPLVISRAESGDQVAADILEQAARSLAQMVQSVRASLSLPVELPLAVTGGFLLNASSVRARMIEQLESSGVRPDVTLVRESVRGAVALARTAPLAGS